ncbi:hypothetical protein [Tsukamurella spumae]|nr:hypothetical protein [Tsukamurella spumae]
MTNEAKESPPPKLWTMASVADYSGLTKDTIKSYYRKRLLPPQDFETESEPPMPLWYPETIKDKWVRRGRGARTDLNT